jgi:hypothetical protein
MNYVLMMDPQLKDVCPSIQPIDVIERWALCHHLGCVVRYLARTGHKTLNPKQPQLGQPRREQTCLGQASLGQLCLEPAHLEQAHLQQVCLEQPRLRQTHWEETCLGELKKAEWYLARELSLSRQCGSVPMGPQPFTTEAVLDAWDLSFHVGEALFHIKASKSPSMREESLKQAMRHLKAEIANLETRLDQFL